MTGPETAVGRFYEPWRIYNERIIEAISGNGRRQLDARL
jgi:hypothetical protein